MAISIFKYVLLFSITLVTLDVVDSQLAAIATRLPQIITLLDNVTDTSAIQTEIKDTLIQTAATQTEMKDTLIQVANTQNQMVNGFNQMVNLMQMQSQQLQNMTVTMTNVISVLEKQQKTLELLNRLPVPIPPSDCSDIAAQGYYVSKSYTIAPSDGMGSFAVHCDMTTDGGGWTVFQRRFDGMVDFYLGWDEYVNGFGSTDGEYWLGLENIHRLMTSNSVWILRIDLEDFEGNKPYAQYESFHVGDTASNYTLSTGAYNGTAGDGLTRHNNEAFSTKDRDNDSNVGHCAVKYKGGWWYNNCYDSNLNGLWLGEGQQSNTGMVWWDWKRDTVLKRSEMKMRQVY